MPRRPGLTLWKHPPQPSRALSPNPFPTSRPLILPNQHWSAQPIPPSHLCPTKNSPGRAIGINLFQYDRLRSQRLSPWR